MKKFLIKIALLLVPLIFSATIALSGIMAMAATAHATDFGFKNFLEDFKKGVEEQSDEMTDGEGQIILPTFTDENEDLEGAMVIVAAIDRFLDFFKLIVTPIALLTIAIMGVKMVTAGRENEQVATKAKNYIRYAVEGLITIFVADQVVAVIFGAEGEIFRGGEAGAKEFGRATSTFFEGLYSLVQTIIASVAVFVIVIAGMRYVGGSASEDQIAKAKQQITWALVGLFVVGVSEFVVKEIIFQQQGEVFGVREAQALFAQVTNFIAGTIGTLAFAFMLYAGYLYVTAGGNEDQVAKAKTILTGAFIGIILAASAFAITSTIVELDASR